MSRRKIIDATCSLLAEGDVAAVRVTEVVRRAHVGRKTFYNAYSGLGEAIDAAFEYAASRALYEARSGDLTAFKAWVEGNPDLVRTVLLAGPQISLGWYRSLVFNAADAISDFDSAALDGALTVAAKRAREGRPIDGELIDELAMFCGHYVGEAA